MNTSERGILEKILDDVTTADSDIGQAIGQKASREVTPTGDLTREGQYYLEGVTVGILACIHVHSDEQSRSVAYDESELRDIVTRRERELLDKLFLGELPNEQPVEGQP